jgi:hypothetical protein
MALIDKSVESREHRKAKIENQATGTYEHTA